jgi:hypothetical protein
MGRYDGVDVATLTLPDGAGGTREVRYLRRRTLPDPRAVRPMSFHPVVAGDRLDLLAARYLADPTAGWRLADANVVVDPEELTAPEAEGDVLVIPLPGV